MTTDGRGSRCLRSGVGGINCGVAWNQPRIPLEVICFYSCWLFIMQQCVDPVFQSSSRSKNDTNRWKTELISTYDDISELLSTYFINSGSTLGQSFHFTFERIALEIVAHKVWLVCSWLNHTKWLKIHTGLVFQKPGTLIRKLVSEPYIFQCDELRNMPENESELLFRCSQLDMSWGACYRYKTYHAIHDKMNKRACWVSVFAEFFSSSVAKSMNNCCNISF